MNMRNCTSAEIFKPFSSWFQVVMVTMLILEAIFGCLANLSVIIVFFKRGRWNGVTAVFMVNLAFIDILICAIMVPLSAAQIVLFPRHNIALRIVHNSLLSGLRFTSVATLVAISYERMESVTRPLRVHATNVRKCLLVVWGLGLPCSILPIFALESRSFSMDRTCNARLEVFQLGDLLIFLTLCLILFYNYHTVQTAARNRAFNLPVMLFKGTAALPEVSSLSTQLKHQKDKVISLSRMIVSSVLLLWTPYLGLSFAKFFVGSSQDIEIASAVLLLVAYANHVLHPVLYAVPSSHWREAALQTFPFLNERSRHDSAVSSVQRRRVAPTQNIT